MKKWAIGLLSVLLASTAMAESGMDRMFKELKLVDDNYVYTDMEAVNALFYELRNEQLENQKANNANNDDISFDLAAMAAMTPTYMQFEIKMTPSTPEEARVKIIDKLTSPEKNEEFCQKTILANRFMQANDYNILGHVPNWIK